MGNLFTKGTLATRRFRAIEAIEARMGEERFLRGIRAHAFCPIDPAGEETTSYGWVAPLDDEDADLTRAKVFADGAAGLEVRLGLRVDTLKPPADEVKRQVAARAAEIEKSEGRPVGRRERRLLKEEVTRALRQRTFPRHAVVQAVWLLAERRVYLGSQSKAMVERFLDLFVKSFGVKIDVEGAGAWAAAVVAPEQLRRLEPTRELWLGFAGVRPLSAGAEEGA